MNKISVCGAISCQDEGFKGAAQWPTRILEIFAGAKILTVLDFYWKPRYRDFRRYPGCGEKTFYEINSVLVRWGFPDLTSFMEQYESELDDTEIGLTRGQVALLLDVYQNEEPSHLKARRKNGPIDPRWYAAAIRSKRPDESAPGVCREMLFRCTSCL